MALLEEEIPLFYSQASSVMPIRRIRKLKPQRLTKPNVLSFIAYTLILFFGTTILVNINPNANESYRQDRESRIPKPMQWIFIADSGEQHELFSAAQGGEHASAEHWDYLLPGEESTSSGAMLTGEQTPNLPSQAT